MLRWLKTVVVSDEEKARGNRVRWDWERERERTADEVSRPVRWHRNRGTSVARDEPGEYPFTGQVVPGMKATRARSAAFAWNVRRQVPTLDHREGTPLSLALPGRSTGLKHCSFLVANLI